jgi:phosphopantothenoylcysteine decarboxylase
VNILLGITGSVAAIKVPELIAEMKGVGEVKVVVTPSALKIIKKIKGYKVGPDDVLLDKDDKRIVVAPLITEEDEWEWNEIGDPVLHIDLKDWADILVVAPLTANTLAKMANGLCDNLLTCIIRAWPIDKPIVIAPAMNTDMWRSPHTHHHLDCLHQYYCWRVDPVEKKLACGTTGIGAMAAPETIAQAVRDVDNNLYQRTGYRLGDAR